MLQGFVRDGPSAQLQPAGFSADPECSQATNSCVGVYTHKIVVKIKKKKIFLALPGEESQVGWVLGSVAMQ